MESQQHIPPGLNCTQNQLCKKHDGQTVAQRSHDNRREYSEDTGDETYFEYNRSMSEIADEVFAPLRWKAAITTSGSTITLRHKNHASRNKNTATTTSDNIDAILGRLIKRASRILSNLMQKWLLARVSSYSTHRSSGEYYPFGLYSSVHHQYENCCNKILHLLYRVLGEFQSHGVIPTVPSPRQCGVSFDGGAPEKVYDPLIKPSAFSVAHFTKYDPKKAKAYNETAPCMDSDVISERKIMRCFSEIAHALYRQPFSLDRLARLGSDCAIWGVEPHIPCSPLAYDVMRIICSKCNLPYTVPLKSSNTDAAQKPVMPYLLADGTVDHAEEVYYSESLNSSDLYYYEYPLVVNNHMHENDAALDNRVDIDTFDVFYESYHCAVYETIMNIYCDETTFGRFMRSHRSSQILQLFTKYSNAASTRHGETHQEATLGIGSTIRNLKNERLGVQHKSDERASNTEPLYRPRVNSTASMWHQILHETFPVTLRYLSKLGVADVSAAFLDHNNDYACYRAEMDAALFRQWLANKLLFALGNNARQCLFLYAQCKTPGSLISKTVKALSPSLLGNDHVMMIIHNIHKMTREFSANSESGYFNTGIKTHVPVTCVAKHGIHYNNFYVTRPKQHNQASDPMNSYSAVEPFGIWSHALTAAKLLYAKLSDSTDARLQQLTRKILHQGGPALNYVLCGYTDSMEQKVYASVIGDCLPEEANRKVRFLSLDVNNSPYATFVTSQKPLVDDKHCTLTEDGHAKSQKISYGRWTGKRALTALHSRDFMELKHDMFARVPETRTATSHADYKSDVFDNTAVDLNSSKFEISFDIPDNLNAITIEHTSCKRITFQVNTHGLDLHSLLENRRIFLRRVVVKNSGVNPSLGKHCASHRSRRLRPCGDVGDTHHYEYRLCIVCH